MTCLQTEHSILIKFSCDIKVFFRILNSQSQRSGSNRRPTVYKTVALPTELRWQMGRQGIARRPAIMRDSLKPCGFNISANRENYVFPTPFLCKSYLPRPNLSNLKTTFYFSKWAGKDLHLGRREPADLQSAPFDYFGTCPQHQLCF